MSSINKIRGFLSLHYYISTKYLINSCLKCKQMQNDNKKKSYTLLYKKKQKYYYLDQ